VQDICATQAPYNIQEKVVKQDKPVECIVVVAESIQLVKNTERGQRCPSAADYVKVRLQTECYLRTATLFQHAEQVQKGSGWPLYTEELRGILGGATK
jgi:peptide methionine sulfoxide reductase MsrB